MIEFNIRRLIYIMIAVLLSVLAVKLFIWALPIIIIVLLANYIYKIIRRVHINIKEKYDKVKDALEMVNDVGYGIVMPDVDELRLEEPQITKNSGSYGVRLRASAQSIHMIRANIETEINPIVGTEQQSTELIEHIMKDFEEEPKRIWESNMFGKSLYELVNEGLHSKLEHMPDDARRKLSETLERVINEGSGGLICIIL